MHYVINKIDYCLVTGHGDKLWSGLWFNLCVHLDSLLEKMCYPLQG